MSRLIETASFGICPAVLILRVRDKERKKTSRWLQQAVLLMTHQVAYDFEMVSGRMRKPYMIWAHLPEASECEKEARI